MAILETGIVAGAAFLFGCLFGNSSCGQRQINSHPSEDTRLKQQGTADILRIESDLKSYGSSSRRASASPSGKFEDGSLDMLEFDRYDHKELSPVKLSDPKKVSAAEDLRKKAMAHSIASSQYVKDAIRAKEDVDRSNMNKLYVKAETEAAHMEQCNLEAASIYFKHNNPEYKEGGPIEEVDLHGLLPKEAAGYVDLIMKDLTARPVVFNTISPTRMKKHVIFSVGKGHENERKTRYAVEKAIMQTYGLKVTAEKPVKGCLWVDLN